MATHFVIHFERYILEAPSMGEALRAAADIADDLQQRGGFLSSVEFTNEGDDERASGTIHYRLETHDEVDELEAKSKT